MGQVDIGMKGLLGHPDVFADVMNAFGFEGRQVLRGETMRCIAAGGTRVTGEGGILQVFRSVCMEHVKSGMQFLIIGIENQGDMDGTMSGKRGGQSMELAARNRKKGIYAGMHQILRNQRLHPVMTIVLYYGEERWEKPMDIRDLMLIPEGEEYQSILPYLQNYRMKLIHVNQLTEQELEYLHSDFKLIAKLMNQRYQEEKVLENLQHDLRRINYLKDTLCSLQELTKNRWIMEKVTGKIEEEETVVGNILDYLIEKTEAETKKRVENRYARLTMLLLEDERYDELQRIAMDRQYRDALYEKYCIL